MRIGKFEISDYIFRETDFHPFLLNELFSKIMIVRAEQMFYKSVIEYIGISELFDDIPDGEVIPTYVFTFTRIYDEEKETATLTLDKVERV